MSVQGKGGANVLYISNRNSGGGKKRYGRSPRRKIETACHCEGCDERIIV